MSALWTFSRGIFLDGGWKVVILLQEGANEQTFFPSVISEPLCGYPCRRDTELCSVLSAASPGNSGSIHGHTGVFAAPAISSDMLGNQFSPSGQSGFEGM